MKTLIVEDSAELRTVLRKGLEAEGYAVDEAEDGASGSFAARTNDYDVLILDNELPRKPGILICKEVRDIGRHTPILMLSVKSDAREKTQHLEAGADDYLSKPFSFDELKARLKALTRRPQSIAFSTLSIGGVSLDTTKVRVSVDDKQIYLTRREFSLLEHLMRRSESVVTRSELIEKVWDSSVSPLSNTVEAHVMTIRRKLGTHSGILKSVPGRGYMITTDKHIWDRSLSTNKNSHKFRKISK